MFESIKTESIDDIKQSDMLLLDVGSYCFVHKIEKSKSIYNKGKKYVVGFTPGKEFCSIVWYEEILAVLRIKSI